MEEMEVMEVEDTREEVEVLEEVFSPKVLPRHFELEAGNSLQIREAGEKMCEDWRQIELDWSEMRSMNWPTELTARVDDFASLARDYIQIGIRFGRCHYPLKLVDCGILHYSLDGTGTINCEQPGKIRIVGSFRTAKGSALNSEAGASFILDDGGEIDRFDAAGKLYRIKLHECYNREKNMGENGETACVSVRTGYIQVYGPNEVFARYYDGGSPIPLHRRLKERARILELTVWMSFFEKRGYEIGTICGRAPFEPRFAKILFAKLHTPLCAGVVRELCDVSSTLCKYRKRALKRRDVEAEPETCKAELAKWRQGKLERRECHNVDTGKTNTEISDVDSAAKADNDRRHSKKRKSGIQVIAEVHEHAATVKKEILEDLEDERENFGMQTLYTNIWQGKFDEVVKLALEAGVDQRAISAIRDRKDY